MTRWHLSHRKFGRKPWAVQEEGMRRANGQKRFGQFLQQGLGKTALDLNEFIDVNDADLNVVFAPNSFMADWPLACEEWGLGFLKTGMWPRDPLPFDWDSGLYVIGHETLRGSRRARDELLQLFKQRRCFFTLDESSGIKNPQSKLADFVIGGVCKEAKYARLLNGTPLVQNVMDYFPQMRALGLLNGTNRVNFQNRYASMGGFMGKQIIGIVEEREHELGEMLDGVSFRALKRDWRKDMPEQVEQTVHVDMTDNQRKHYQTMMEEFYVAVNDDQYVVAEMVLTQMDKLRQISACVIMDRNVNKERVVHWLEEPKNNPKLKAVFDIHETGNGKSIIVHFYKPTGEMLMKACEKAGYKPARIAGRALMSPEQLIEEKRRFNDDPDCRVIVCQQDQASRGHTLIGQPGRNRCNKTIYFENSFSQLQRAQMNDRNHRGEQDETCNIYDIVTSPMDQVVIDILQDKKELADKMDAVVAEIRRAKNAKA